MKRAILADIHADPAALQAVLADATRLGAEEVYCLGDVVGLGLEPRACLEIARGFALNLLGECEEAVLFGAIGFHPKARASIERTREELSRPDRPVLENRNLWCLLEGLRKQHLEGDLLFVHGSPRDPTREYLLPQDVQDPMKMAAVFVSPPDLAWRACFAAHTHFPGAFFEGEESFSFQTFPDGGEIDLETIEGRAIVNVGSVSRGRDADLRASYVLLDGRRVRFCRVDAPRCPDGITTTFLDGQGR
jgi:hypothetical protein